MSKSPETISIGEVAKKVGLRPSALRYYESMGILPAPKRASGQRLYDDSIFKHIRLIQAAQKAGFSIKEIEMVLDESENGVPYAERLQELARQKLVEVEKLIADAQSTKQALEAGLDCRCTKIEDCLLFMK